VRVNFPRRYSFAQSKLISRGDIHLETQKGVFHHYTLFARRGRDYLFTPLTEAEAAQFETLDLAVGGRANPFVIIPDDTGTAMWFVRKRAEHVEEGSDTSFFSYRLNLVEESRGTDIEA
jgi:hypothetical protein